MKLKLKFYKERRPEDPNIWSRRMTRPMATAVSISGCTIRRKTSEPNATPPTASFFFISATRLLLPSYTAHALCAYDPSISYSTFLLFVGDDDDDPSPPLQLTCARHLLVRMLTCFFTENRGFTSVFSPSYTSQLSPRLNLWMITRKFKLYLIKLPSRSLN